MLKTTRTVIVDEIHTLAPNKRGSHLDWLVEEVGIAEPAATQLVNYMASAHAALGTLPT